MKIYLVGGAVRDELLQLPVKDKDWVVVGATPQEMLNAGYQQVGKEFPVFLHPVTHEEYALARTERKSGPGYTGFTCYAAPDVTLEQDLLRRDLTLNAIAQDQDGSYIDPFHGQQDIKQRVLRHVSPAFSEDPLRVLRVARFAARYANLNFYIAPETLTLMRNISQSGELNHLIAERVWKETQHALLCARPEVYFAVLHQCGALAVLFPEIAALFDIPEQQHLQTDTGLHSVMALANSARLSPDPEVRFAALCHSLGQGNISTGVKQLEQLCQRLRVPNQMCDLARLVIEYQAQINSLPCIQSQTIVQLFDNLDAWRKPQRITQLALINEAAWRGYPDDEQRPYPQAGLLREAWKAAQQVTNKEVIDAGFSGPAIRDELTRRRVQAITQWQAALRR